MTPRIATPQLALHAPWWAGLVVVAATYTLVALLIWATGVVSRKLDIRKLMREIRETPPC